ncbi:hypothetical protein [Reichenbachiella sp. MALMAid0571]|uniref:hypothetical protein n=1 Tax=Reichenbachiella sp. MALMAid0571 TaxID=3143939 RepID=UPI0032DEC09F
MNKFSRLLLLISVLLLIVAESNAQTPVSIPARKVPKIVLKSFKELHPDANEVKWYPYPYHYHQGSDVSPTFLPILWENNTPNYYEARFSDEKGEVRNIFDFGGSWYVTSRPLAGNLPVEIEVQLKEKGYGIWKRHNEEQIVKSGEDGKFYKVWLTDKNKKRILYFNESYKLVKILKLDNDINFTEEDHEKFKNAPGFSKQEKTVTEKDVPAQVQTSANQNHLDVDVIEWSIHERLYDPFQNSIFDHGFYDLEVPVLYQLLFFDKDKKYKVTYNAQGEILEEVEVIERKDLPDEVLNTLKSDQYKDWVFDSEHERILYGKRKSLYRIYGKVMNEAKQLILDAKGNITKVKTKEKL